MTTYKFYKFSRDVHFKQKTALCYKFLIPSLEYYHIIKFEENQNLYREILHSLKICITEYVVTMVAISLSVCVLLLISCPTAVL